MVALGVYLRKFFIENLNLPAVCIDTGCFGTFCMIDDSDASEDALYSKKIVFKP